MPRIRSILSLLLVFGAGNVRAADWPMWRHDAARTGVTSEELPVNLRLAWSRVLPPNHLAWAEDPRLQFDASIEPIVVGKTMLVASSTTDSLTALDTDTGRERWKFYADGPVRLTPVASGGKVYFGADDGYFRCVDIESGALVWKLLVAPSERRVLGNERLISMWPVRGGPVIADQKLYFTVGVWPFEGTVLYAVDLKESDGAVPAYTVTSLNDISPQGHLVYNDGKLFIPGGRAKATCIDLATGKIVPLKYNARSLTDYYVASAGKLLFHGAKVYHIDLNRAMPFEAVRPVSDGATVYTIGLKKLVAYDMTKRTSKKVQVKDRRGKVKEVVRDQVPVKWELAADKIVKAEAVSRIGVKAGDRLYGNRGNVLFAVDTPAAGAAPKVVWKQAVEGAPSSMLAADGKLFAVTREGRIYCFADAKGPAKTYPLERKELASGDDAVGRKARAILEHANDPNGYCVVLGIGAEGLVPELVNQSNLRIIVVDPDADKVATLRSRFDSMGLYGTRVAAIVADPGAVALPPYLATLVVAQGADAAGIGNTFRVLRPYGGEAVIETDDAGFERLEKAIANDALPNALLTRYARFVVLSRPGALPGSADWTHEYGNSGNTLTSADELVKAPLGILWFGGPASSGELYFNRHYWGPGLNVVDGRMFVQGPKWLTAIDIYTGRILWKFAMRKGGGPGRRGTFFEEHRPGFHFVAVDDGIYLVYPDVCLRLDPATGEKLGEFKLPNAKDQWGKVRVWGDRLLVTVFREKDKLGLMPSAVAAVNRYDGKALWSKDADSAVPMMAVGADTVFVFDGILDGFYDAWKRKGLTPKPNQPRYLKALDANTGKQLWERPSERVATWLAYSQDQDVLVVSNKEGVDAVRGSDGAKLWEKQEKAPGFGGHPENVWDKVIVSGDMVIDQRGPGRAFDLMTGKPILQKHPITGESVPWEFTKTGHHCNYAIASPHLVTFRAGTAGFFDRNTGGTARLPGFRSGCRNSLIPAGGVLNAPNYAHGCVCDFNVFTSLAFVHDPQADLWTYNAYKDPTAKAQRLGINLGAPGDRLAENGTLWMEYPRRGDPSAKVPVEVEGKSLRWFKNHTTGVSAGQVPWVAASGVEGISGLTIKLPGADKVLRNHTVRLYFAEPNPMAPETRVFDVAIQGKPVLTNLDIAREAGGARRLLKKELTGIAADDQIALAFTPRKGQPLLCGIEIVAEDPKP